MTRERYFEMQEQMGLEPVAEKIPPDWDDMPEQVLDAVQIFNRLGDRVYPDIGYVGKDFTLLQPLLEAYNIEESEKEFILELLDWLDARAIKKAAEELKRQYDKIKRK